eukprot:comp22174_c0_seq4/m.52118 comp22174_c0_seq4/g.52118  ORF comp22174_c0_seq4/g.52118 comp22174_c0_seq4/m.52118 type:complete len:714 (-) comp22174_c0_seq4:697-2838(-)
MLLWLLVRNDRRLGLVLLGFLVVLATAVVITLGIRRSRSSRSRSSTGLLGRTVLLLLCLGRLAAAALLPARLVICSLLGLCALGWRSGLGCGCTRARRRAVLAVLRCGTLASAALALGRRWRRKATGGERLPAREACLEIKLVRLEQEMPNLLAIDRVHDVLGIQILVVRRLFPLIGPVVGLRIERVRGHIDPFHTRQRRQRRPLWRRRMLHWRAVVCSAQPVGLFVLCSEPRTLCVHGFLPAAVAHRLPVDIERRQLVAVANGRLACIAPRGARGRAGRRAARGARACGNPRDCRCAVHLEQLHEPDAAFLGQGACNEMRDLVFVVLDRGIGAQCKQGACCAAALVAHGHMQRGVSVVVDGIERGASAHQQRDGLVGSAFGCKMQGCALLAVGDRWADLGIKQRAAHIRIADDCTEMQRSDGVVVGPAGLAELRSGCNKHLDQRNIGHPRCNAQRGPSDGVQGIELGLVRKNLDLLADAVAHCLVQLGDRRGLALGNEIGGGVVALAESSENRPNLAVESGFVFCIGGQGGALRRAAALLFKSLSAQFLLEQLLALLIGTGGVFGFLFLALIFLFLGLALGFLARSNLLLELDKLGLFLLFLLPLLFLLGLLLLVLGLLLCLFARQLLFLDLRKPRGFLLLGHLFLLGRLGRRRLARRRLGHRALLRRTGIALLLGLGLGLGLGRRRLLLLLLGRRLARRCGLLLRLLLLLL